MKKFIVEFSYTDKNTKRNIRYLAGDRTLSVNIADAIAYEYSDINGIYRVLYNLRGIMPSEFGVDMLNKNIVGVTYGGERVQ